MGCSIQADVDVFENARHTQLVDSSPMCLDLGEGGRACPSAGEEWIRAVLEVWEQCISLTGEISRQAT